MWDRPGKSQSGSLMRQALAWVLLPVAVFSSQLTMPCRCGDGRIKLICSRVVDVSRRSGEYASEGTCNRPCCCETLRGQCGGHGTCPGCGRTMGAIAGCAGRECCCAPLLHALFMSAKGVRVPTLLHTSCAFIGVKAALSERGLLCEALCSHVLGLPPSDLVILHRTLRI